MKVPPLFSIVKDIAINNLDPKINTTQNEKMKSFWYAITDWK